MIDGLIGDYIYILCLSQIVVKRFEANAGTGDLIARGFALLDKRTTLNEQLPCAALAAGLPFPTGEAAAPIVTGVPSSVIFVCWR